MLFVKVAESSDNADDSVEIPVEPQGHILMSTLTAQFPAACGLKYKTEQFSWRGVRVVDDKLYPPGDDKWDSSVYIVTYPKDAKRKGDDLDINSAKSRKIERKCVDLIVLGIPWKSTEEVVKRYFEQYGEVVLCEIKRDAANNSKGFGFVRFKEYNNQCSVLGKKHFIDGRWCDVKIPNSQEPETSRKIFVGRLSETLTAKDLQDYFGQYGQVIDVYIPKPFRAFGFVTFVEADIAQGLCGESHIISGVSVHVSRADPKEEENGAGGGGGGGGPGANGMANSYGGMHAHHAMAQHQYGGMAPHQYGGGLNGMPANGNGAYGRGDPSRRFSNGAMGHQMMGAKSMGQMRNKMKYVDHQSSMGGAAGNGAVDLYADASGAAARHADVRSPSMAAHHVAHMQGNGAGVGHGNGMPAGAQGHDQMNAMMNMFNPMMAAFIQQLASQSMPPNSQSTIEAAHNGAAAAAVASLGGSAGGNAGNGGGGGGGGAVQWSSAPNSGQHADYSGRNGAGSNGVTGGGVQGGSVQQAGGANGVGAGYGYAQQQHAQRFKPEKNF